MPKSKRNKIVDLSKTKKHGLEGKKELYKKIQTNVENYAHVFVFAVNDMRNSKMKHVREQWKHSRFCIGKNKVMAMALGRSSEEEYRPNLHKISQMLVGERGLLFTNQSIDEVTNWFQSYSVGDYARSGNIATEDVILPEGPLAQFPHSLESYLRHLGLPTTLKKGVIHLIKEHVVCKEGDRLSPEVARILKLLGYEMAEFQIKILGAWSQDGSFVNFQSDSFDPDSKENITSPPKSFMREDFELAKDCVLLGNDEMEVAEDDSKNVNIISTHSEKEEELKYLTEDPEVETEILDVKLQTTNGKKTLMEEKSVKTLTISKQAATETKAKVNAEIICNEKVSSKEIADGSAILKMTEKKLEETVEKPKKFSPKMTRARAAAANKIINTPESIEIKRSSRKRKM